MRLRVSADERYELFLDGRRIGRGRERGTPEHWFYDTLRRRRSAAGAHVLVARVFSLGPLAPLAQFQVRPAFLLAAEGEEAKRLDTGVAAWEARRLPGYSFEPPVYVWGLAAPVTVDGDGFAWGFERGEGDGWRPVVAHERASSALLAYGIAPSRYLQAGTLPPMIDRPWTRARVRHVAEVPSLDTLPIARPRRRPPRERDGGLAGACSSAARRCAVPAHTRAGVIVDLEDYVCAYPALVTSGGKGSLVRLQFAEALREPGEVELREGQPRRRSRASSSSAWATASGPTAERSAASTSLWFASGRYLEIVVRDGRRAADDRGADACARRATRSSSRAAFSGQRPGARRRSSRCSCAACRRARTRPSSTARTSSRCSTSATCGSRRSSST